MGALESIQRMNGDASILISILRSRPFFKGTGYTKPAYAEVAGGGSLYIVFRGRWRRFPRG